MPAKLAQLLEQFGPSSSGQVKPEVAVKGYAAVMQQVGDGLVLLRAPGGQPVAGYLVELAARVQWL